MIPTTNLTSTSVFLPVNESPAKARTPQLDSKVREMASKLSALNLPFNTPPRPRTARLVPSELLTTSSEPMSTTPLRLSLPSNVKRRRSAGLKFTPTKNLDDQPVIPIALPAVPTALPRVSKTHSVALTTFRVIVCLGAVFGVYILAKRIVNFNLFSWK
jgi:hypothetical protein